MSNNSVDSDVRCLVVAITDFLRDQLQNRTDFLPEDRDCLEISIQCLEMAYDLDANGYVQFRFARPLLDIFNQVTHPVSVRAKLAAEAHKDEGNTFMRQGIHQRADEEYTRAIQLDPWNAVYYCNRASARIEKQLYFEAISDCRQALLLNPDYAKAYARMGQAYALIRRPREAARCFRQALELEPDNERFRNNLNVAERQAPRSDAAGMFETLLGSIFGMRPQVSGNSLDVAETMSPSFVIITESHPATRIDANETTGEKTGAITEDQIQDRHDDEPTRRIYFPSQYGVVDETAEEETSERREFSYDADLEGQGSIRQQSFLEIPYFNDTRGSPTPFQGEASSSKISESCVGNESRQETPNGEQKKRVKFNVSNKKRNLARTKEFLPRHPSQRQNFTQLPEAGRDSLRYPLNEINKKLQVKLNQTKEFVKTTLTDSTTNLRKTISQTAEATHSFLDDINHQIQIEFDDTNDLALKSFSIVEHEFQRSKNVNHKLLNTLCNIKDKILSILNETKEFIQTLTRNIKILYQTPESQWEDFLASIHDMNDQIQIKLDDTKRYVASSLSKVNSNLLVPDADSLASVPHDSNDEGENETREPWKSCFDGKPCFRHKCTSSSLIESLRVSATESRNVKPKSLTLTSPLVKEIEDVIESLDIVNDQTMIKILETKEKVNMTLGRMQIYLEQSFYTPDECFCLYLDSMESDVRDKVKETKLLVERHITVAENHLNRALSDANHNIVFSLNDIKLEIKSRLNEAEEDIKGFMRSIDWNMKIEGNSTENLIFPDFDGIKRSVEKQLDETQRWTEKTLNVAKRYFTRLLGDTKDPGHSPVEQICKNLLDKINEIGTAVKASFDSAIEQIKMPGNQEQEQVKNNLEDINNNAKAKIDEITQFALESFIHAKDEVQDIVDASGNSLDCYIDELQNNILSEIVDIECFLRRSLEKAISTHEIPQTELVDALYDIPEKVQIQLKNLMEYLSKSFSKISQSVAVAAEVGVEISQILPFKSIAADAENKINEIIKSVKDNFESAKNHLQDNANQESLTNTLEDMNNNLNRKIGEVTGYIHDAFNDAENYMKDDLNIKEERLPQLLAEVRNDILSNMKNIEDFVNCCVEEAKATLQMPSDGIDDSLLKYFDEMSARIQNKLTSTKEVVKISLDKAEFDIGELIMNNRNCLAFLLSNLSDKIRSEITGTEETVEKLFESARRIVLQSESMSKEHLCKILNGINSDVNDKVSKTVKAVEAIFDAAEESVTNKINEVEDSGIKVVGDVKTVVLSEISEIAKFADSALGDAECMLMSHRRDSQEFFSFSIAGVQMKVRNKISKTKENVKQELKKIRQTKVTDFEGEAKHLHIFIFNVNKKIKNEITEIDDTLKDSLENAKTLLKSKDSITQESLQNILDDSKNIIINKMSKVKTDVSTILDSLHEGVKNVKGKIEEPLKYILHEMKQSIESSIDKAWVFAENRLEEAKSNLKMPETGVDDSLLNTFDQILKDIQIRLNQIRKVLDSATSKVLNYFKPPIEETAKYLSRFTNESRDQINLNIKHIENTLKMCFENAKSYLQTPENETQESLIMCLENINETFSTKINDLENSVDGIFETSIINVDKNLIEDKKFREAVGEFKENVKSATCMLTRNINGAIDKAKSSLQMPKDGVDDSLLRAFDEVFLEIQTEINKTKDTVDPTREKFVESMTSSCKVTAKSVKDTMCDINENINLTIQEIDKTLATSFESAKIFLQKPGNNTQDNLQKCLDDININLQKKIQDAEKSLGNLLNSSALDAGNLSGSEKEHIATCVDNLKVSMKSVMDEKKRFVGECLDKAKSSLKAPKEGADPVINSLDGIQKDIQTKLNGMKCTETNLLQKVQQDVLSTVDAVADAKQKVEDTLFGFTNAIGIPGFSVGLDLNAEVGSLKGSAGAQTKLTADSANIGLSMKEGEAQSPTATEQDDDSSKKEEKEASKNSSQSGQDSNTSKKVEATSVRTTKQTVDSDFDSSSDSEKSDAMKARKTVTNNN